MRHKNTISFDDLSEVIKVKTTRTLDTTAGFPKPEVIKGNYLYPISEVCKFFKIDSLDEPFITVEEASQILGESTSYITGNSYKNRIPSYKLKHDRGSAYLYRKSELDLYMQEKNRITLTPDSEYINRAMFKIDLGRMFLEFLKAESVNILSPHEVTLIKSYLLDNKTFEELGAQRNLTRERIRQIYNRAIRKTNNYMLRITKSDFASVYKENILLKRKVALLTKIQEMDADQAKPDNSKDTQVLFIDFLSKEIEHVLIGMSVRSRTCMINADFKYVYQLFEYYYKAMDSRIALKKIRNMGNKSANELISIIETHSKDYEESLNLVKFFNSLNYDYYTRPLIIDIIKQHQYAKV